VPRRTRRPSWLDPRLIVGILMVLGSVLFGAKVVSSARSTQIMWGTARSLDAGSVVRADDLKAMRVRLLDGAAAYLPTRTAVVGQTVVRHLAAGELLPRAALGATAPGTTITVPLDTQVAPKIQRGQRIRLWVSTKSCTAVTVLDDITVQDVQTGGSSAFSSASAQSAVIRVSPALAQRVAVALALDGAQIRAGIVDGPASGTPNDRLPTLAGCTAKKS
jgi:hypothetical protein